MNSTNGYQYKKQKTIDPDVIDVAYQAGYNVGWNEAVMHLGDKVFELPLPPDTMHSFSIFFKECVK
jgi:hypothetical protein